MRDVRFGSLADVADALPNVRFTPESGHHRASLACPLSANSGHLPLTALKIATVINIENRR
jgi:hypothetical protein